MRLEVQLVGWVSNLIRKQLITFIIHLPFWHQWTCVVWYVGNMHKKYKVSNTFPPIASTELSRTWRLNQQELNFHLSVHLDFSMPSDFSQWCLQPHHLALRLHQEWVTIGSACIVLGTLGLPNQTVHRYWDFHLVASLHCDIFPKFCALTQRIPHLLFGNQNSHVLSTEYKFKVLLSFNVLVIQHAVPTFIKLALTIIMFPI